MGYSPLVDKIMSTSKHSSRQGASITRMLIHHWAGTGGGIERLVHSKDPASANYIILTDGTLIGSVDEKYRAWTSGSFAADQPSITVEVQNSTGAPGWNVSAAAIATLTRLIADVAKRHQWSGAINRTRVRGHREFKATACPGPYLYPRLDQIAADANRLRNGNTGGGSPVTARMASPAEGRFTSGYGRRNLAIAPFHAGVDIAPPIAGTIGTPIHAAFAGTVEKAGANIVQYRSGNGVLVRNPDGERQYYGHLSRIRVKVGQRVSVGERIGDMGATGNVTGAHLHFETWANSSQASHYDPMILFRKYGVTIGSRPQTNTGGGGTPAPKPTPERTWFDMASAADLRKIIREEIRSTGISIAGKTKAELGVNEVSLAALARYGAASLFEGRETPAKVWSTRGLDYVNDNATTKNHQLAKAHEYARLAAIRAGESLAKVTALQAAVRELAKGQGIDADKIDAAINKAVKDALADLTVTLTTSED